jgi:hypothetical protein
MFPFWLKQRNLGRLHICIGRNDVILMGIADGSRKQRSFHLDRVPNQIFLSGRINQFFINIDWV